MKVEPRQLRAFMLDAGLIRKKTFDKALEKAERENIKVEDVLINKRIVSQENLNRLKAYILGIPFVDLGKETISPEVLRIIPEPIARSHNIISFKKRGKKLEVAMLDLEDLKSIKFIEEKTNLKIVPRLTDSKSLKKTLSQYRNILKEEFKGIIKKEAEEKSKEEAGEMPVIRMVDTLLKQAFLQRASVVHIEPGEKELYIRYRIDGILREAMTLPLKVGPGITARIKILSNLKLDSFPQNGSFEFNKEGFNLSCRVSILPIFGGEKVVIRLFSGKSKTQTLENLGLRGKNLEKVEANLRKSSGMILIAGPTGSGKTTTLYSMIDILNNPEVNISTIEDPIEYRIPRINQSQVNSNIGLSFSRGLRSLLRQDPDVLVVGEIKDKETAWLALSSALIGRLVIATIKADSAAEAVSQLLKMKLDPILISSALNLVLAQRLVRKLSEKKEPYKLKNLKKLKKHCQLNKLKEALKKEKLLGINETIKDINFYKPEEGYKGRIGIFEVLEVSRVVKDLIKEKASQSKIEKNLEHRMAEDGFLKAARGETSIEEVLKSL